MMDCGLGAGEETRREGFVAFLRQRGKGEADVVGGIEFDLADRIPEGAPEQGAAEEVAHGRTVAGDFLHDGGAGFGVEEEEAVGVVVVVSEDPCGTGVASSGAQGDFGRCGGKVGAEGLR